jgi:hypothetical protein
MRHFLLAILPLLLSGVCNAAEVKPYDRHSPQSDDKYIVGMECNRHDNHLEIGFFDAYNVPAKRMDLWDTWDLKKNKQDKDVVDKVLSVTRGCDIGGQHYQVKITGEPGNWNLNGECGGVTYAKAKVWKNGALVFDDAISTCADGRTLKLIAFYPDRDQPVRKQGDSLSALYD